MRRQLLQHILLKSYLSKSNTHWEIGSPRPFRHPFPTILSLFFCLRNFEQSADNSSNFLSFAISSDVEADERFLLPWQPVNNGRCVKLLSPPRTQTSLCYWVEETLLARKWVQLKSFALKAFSNQSRLMKSVFTR